VTFYCVLLPSSVCHPFSLSPVVSPPPFFFDHKCIAVRSSNLFPTVFPWPVCPVRFVLASLLFHPRPRLLRPVRCLVVRPCHPVGNAHSFLTAWVARSLRSTSTRLCAPPFRPPDLRLFTCSNSTHRTVPFRLPPPFFSSNLDFS